MIDLRRLEYACVLASNGSYARASEKLGISQPALTRAIQTLERDYGTRLFDRDRAGARPTAHGRAILAAGAALLSDAERLEREWRDVAGGSAGGIRFGMAPMAAHALLDAVLVDRLAENPGVRNEVVVRNVGEMWPMLIDGRIEFFVAAGGQVPDAPPVRHIDLGKFPADAIVRAGHPLTLQSASESGARYPLLVSSPTAARVPECLDLHAAGPPHVIEDFATLARVTANSDSIWLSSRLAIRTELARGELEVLAWPELFGEPVTMTLYAPVRKSRSPASLEMQEKLRRIMARLNAEAFSPRVP